MYIGSFEEFFVLLHLVSIASMIPSVSSIKLNSSQILEEEKEFIDTKSP